MAEFLQMLNQIFEICVIPLLGILTTYLVNYIKVKQDELVKTSKNDLTDKYIIKLSEIVQKSVIAVNQTYVESLKAQGKFDAEAQAEAFQTCYDTVMAVVDHEMREVLLTSVGDLHTYLTVLIEQEVNKNKG